MPRGIMLAWPSASNPQLVMIAVYLLMLTLHLGMSSVRSSAGRAEGVCSHSSCASFGSAFAALAGYCAAELCGVVV